MADPCTEEFFATQAERYQLVKNFLKKERVTAEQDSTPSTTPGPAQEDVDKACDAMMADIDSALTQIAEDHPAYFRLLGMRSTLLYEKARLLIKLSLEESHNLLSTSVEGVIAHALKPEISFIVLRILNHFAYSLAATEVLDMALLLLEKAENIYFMIRTKNIAAGEVNNPVPPVYHTADDLFAPTVSVEYKPETSERLERLVTNNFQMMTFIYNRLEREDLYNAYQNRVLNRQLQMREGDALNWAGKTTKLAQGFLQKLQFENARTHLAAASDILHEYQTDLKKMDQTETTQERLAQVDFRAAELGRSWVKYALTLFSTSKHLLIEKLFHESGQCEFFDTNQLTDATPGNVCANIEPITADHVVTKPEEKPTTDVAEAAKKDVALKQVEEQKDKMEVAAETTDDKTPGQTELDEQNNNAVDNVPTSYEIYTFPTLNLAYIESRVQSEHISNTKEARALFTFTQPWLKRTMSYYNIHDFPTEYVNCILDLSELYRYLAFYEEDTDTQYNVQKRRADTLETLSTVLREGNPTTYIGASVELFRELAEVQIEMLGLNLRRLYAADTAAGEEEGVAAARMTDRANWEMHKMEAVKDVQGRLQEFGAYLLEADMHTDLEEAFATRMDENAEHDMDCGVPSGFPTRENGDAAPTKDTEGAVSIEADSSGDATVTPKIDPKTKSADISNPITV